MTIPRVVNAAMMDHVRAIVRTVVARDFDGNVSRAAAAMGMSQPTLSQFLHGRMTVGIGVLIAIADYEGLSLDGLLGRSPPRNTARRADTAAPHSTVAPPAPPAPPARPGLKTRRPAVR